MTMSSTTRKNVVALLAWMRHLESGPKHFTESEGAAAAAAAEAVKNESLGLSSSQLPIGVGNGKVLRDYGFVIRDDNGMEMLDSKGIEVLARPHPEEYLARIVDSFRSRRNKVKKSRDLPPVCPECCGPRTGRGWNHENWCSKMSKDVRKRRGLADKERWPKIPQSQEPAPTHRKITPEFLFDKIEQLGPVSKMEKAALLSQVESLRVV